RGGRGSYTSVTSTSASRSAFKSPRDMFLSVMVSCTASVGMMSVPTPGWLRTGAGLAYPPRVRGHYDYVFCGDAAAKLAARRALIRDSRPAIRFLRWSSVLKLDELLYNAILTARSAGID
ncbi:MAG: hypothetical protein WAN12_21200, partial [Candidatus Acidiferrum sp.]